MPFSEDKKKIIREYFNEAVRAKLDNDQVRHEKAIKTAKSKGLTEIDFETLEKLDTNTLREDVLGEDCFSNDLQERMREADELAGSFGWGIKPFKGLYPGPK